jgi:uncharacterized LabA/DUF88 family protein
MVSESKGARVHVFVDYWNFQIGLGAHARRANVVTKNQLDWSRLGAWLAHEATRDARFECMHVYMSHSPGASAHEGVRKFARVLARFDGVRVVMKERRVKEPPKCPSCHGTVACCPEPKCHASMAGTQEKGIDTAIVTDMLGLAWSGALDTAVLVSADADFIPAVDALQARGLKVVHAGIEGSNSRLARMCDATIEVTKALGEIRRDAA